MITKRQHFEKRLGALKTERSSFITHWKELSEFVSPRRGRFFTQDRNRGEKRNQRIINSRATMSLRTCVSGMMAGITSPARPWFRLATPDADMMEYEPVRMWLYDVESIMRDIFNQSNLYTALPGLYREFALFGTGNMAALPDFENVLRFQTHTIGSYMVANNQYGLVDTHYREYEMTVGQLVEKFGRDKCSPETNKLFDQGAVDSWVPVVHVIEPNDERDITVKSAKNKRFRSCYYEAGRNDGAFLRESGFDEFPHMVARWDRTGEDIYGTDCPGMTALGDVKELQHDEKRRAQAIDKMVNPPLRGPGSLKNIAVNSLPGGGNFYDSDPSGAKLEPVYDVTMRLGDLKDSMLEIERRIEEAFYVPVFFAISQMDGVQPRNEMELYERKSEALLQLGPMLQNLHGEVLDPLIDRTFNRGIEAGIFPPPPQELQGSPLKVEYISILAQAQRSVGTGTIDRMAAYIGGLAEASGDLSAWDKFDKDQSVDEYAEMIGASPKIIRSDDAVAEMRAARQQQQAMAQMAEMAKPASDMMDAAQKAQEMDAA